MYRAMCNIGCKSVQNIPKRGPGGQGVGGGMYVCVCVCEARRDMAHQYGIPILRVRARTHMLMIVLSSGPTDVGGGEAVVPWLAVR